MDLEKLEKMAKLVLKDLGSFSDRLDANPEKASIFKNLMTVTLKTLPDHKELVANAYREVDETYGLYAYQARSIVRHILAIIEIEKASESKTRAMKIFDSANDKLKQANLSFQKGEANYPTVFHNLNTALELILKDKLGIPTTITKINTSTIIDILVKHKVKPYLYLDEAKKKVLMIDNKIKHQGYSPSKIDCINSMKVMEELISKLRDKEIKLTREIRDKIYQGL